MISEHYSKGEQMRVHGKNWAHRTFQGLNLFDCLNSEMYDWILLYIKITHLILSNWR